VASDFKPAVPVIPSQSRLGLGHTSGVVHAKRVDTPHDECVVVVQFLGGQAGHAPQLGLAPGMLDIEPILVSHLDLLGDEDLAEVLAQDGPEHGHAGADACAVDFQYG